MDLEKIFYTREFRGKITKDGKVFKKYKKIPRLPLLKRKTIFYLILVMLLSAAVAAAFLYTRTHPHLKKFIPDDFQPVVEGG
jgi:hypothetical protein